MTPKSEETDTARVEVIQADREAAAALIEGRAWLISSGQHDWCAVDQKMFREGRKDNHPFVQAFAAARHRLAQASPAVGGQDARHIADELDKLSSSHRPLLSAASAALRASAASAGVRDAGREAMSHLGERFTVSGVLAEMQAIGSANDEDDLADEWPLDCRTDIDRWQAVLRDALLQSNQNARLPSGCSMAGSAIKACSATACNYPFCETRDTALTARPDGREWTPHLDYSGEPMNIGEFRDPPERPGWAAGIIHEPGTDIDELTATGGADREAEIARLREALEVAVGRLSWAASANPGVQIPEGKRLLAQWAGEGRAALDTSAAKEAR